MSSRARWSKGLTKVCAAAALAAGIAVAAAAARPFEAVARPRIAAAPLLHASLLSSEPAAGSVVIASPTRIRLVFSEAIEASLSAVSLVDTGGDSFVLEVAADPRDVRAAVAPAPALVAGVYAVRWHVVSADGHRIDGSFSFTLEGGGAVAVEHDTSLAPQPRTKAATEADGGFIDALGPRPSVAVLRAAAITALLALAGLTLLIATLPISGPRPMRLASILAVLATVLLAAYTAVWSSASVGEGRGVLDALSLTASTTPGALEVARVALAFLAIGSLMLARRAGLAALFSGVAVLITGASGHPAVSSPMLSIPSKSIHLAAAALWLGGLLWIVTAERHGARYVEGTRRISTLAFVSVIAVVASGIVQTVVFLPRLSALIGSTYGQIVLAKVAGLLVLVLFGAFRRRVVPRLDTTMARRRLRGTVRLEIVVMIVVAVLGGLLATIAPPR